MRLSCRKWMGSRVIWVASPFVGLTFRRAEQHPAILQQLTSKHRFSLVHHLADSKIVGLPLYFGCSVGCVQHDRH
jgi:hypothetical protein